MRGPAIVIFHVTEQQVTKVAFAEYNDVVNALPSDRTDQPFGICVLPRGTRRCWPVANAYRSESADKDLTIGPVPVTNEIAGSLFPPAGFRDLICDPFCGWMRCDAKPQNTSPAVPHDQQSIDPAKRDCRHHEHIHRSDPVSVVGEKRPPALGRRVSSPGHVLGHARLSDIDAELEEFSMDPRRSPQRIGNAHLADKLAYLRRYSWSAPTAPRLPPPVRSEPGAVPFNHGLRLHDRQGAQHLRSQTIQAGEYQTVQHRELRPFRRLPQQHVKLMTQNRFSASSEARDRNASTNPNQIRLQTSRIRQERRPIRYQSPARLSFCHGQAGSLPPNSNCWTMQH